jgi:hypothetical protein
MSYYRNIRFNSRQDYCEAARIIIGFATAMAARRV